MSLLVLTQGTHITGGALPYISAWRLQCGGENVFSTTITSTEKQRYPPKFFCSCVQEVRHDRTAHGGTTSPWPHGDILTKRGAHQVLACPATRCSVTNSTLHFTRSSIWKCKNIALECQYSISSRSIYNLGFYPTDSEKQSPLPSSVSNLWQMGTDDI